MARRTVALTSDKLRQVLNTVAEGTTMNDTAVPYRRVLLKLSGEALMGDLDYGIEPAVIQRLAGEIDREIGHRSKIRPRSRPRSERSPHAHAR